MKLTSSQANKLLKQYNDELAELKEQEEKSSVFIVSLGEDPETVRPDYDFVEMNQRIASLQDEIIKLKHAINMFNTTTKVPPYGITIDEVLVALPQLTREKAKLEKMAARLPKERYRDRYGSNNLVEYEYANYDIQAVKKLLEQTRKTLYEMQDALNKVNTTVEFEF